MRDGGMECFISGMLAGAVCIGVIVGIPLGCRCKEKIEKLNHIIEVIEKHADMESLTADELLSLGRNGYKPNTGEKNDE